MVPTSDPTPMNGNAVATGGIVIAAVSLLCEAARQYGVEIDPGVQTSLVVVVTFIVSLIVRQRVYSELSVEGMNTRPLAPPPTQGPYDLLP